MKTRTQQGFTLIEIAMVVLIIGLITSGLLLGMGGIIDSAKYKDDQQRLKDIKTALLSHVAQKGYLPCPDTDNDGVENRTGNSCESHRGFLPHIDLNTHAYNAYNARFYYHIDNNTPGNPPHTTRNSSDYFDNSTPGTPKFTKDTPSGDISICENWNTTNNACEDDGYLAKNLPLVVVSFGKNSAEAWGGSTDGTPNGCSAPLSAEEQLNCDLDTMFYQAHLVDDTLIWLSQFDIKIASGVIQLSGGNGGSGGDPSTRLDAGLFGNYDTTHAGDYNNNHSITTTNQDNRIRIEDDLNKAINLLNGTDVLSIGGNANASITAGNQDKVLLIEGNANGAGINFGNGNNRIEIRGALNTSIQLGNGDNWVRVEGAVNGSGIQLGNGKNKVYIGGDIYQNIINGGHTDSTLYLNKTPTEWSAVSWQHSKVSGFNQILCRQSSGSLDFVSCT
jgi:prepilin-type N-terminal cleavage/methylation domain-containing protein